MKIVSLSTTDNPLYSFFVPIAAYCWEKLGFNVLIRWDISNKEKIILLAKDIKYYYQYFETNENQAATRSQIVRLFAYPFGGENDIIVTADIDMAVLSFPFELQNPEAVLIVGSDLVPEGQYPMCYAMASAKTWQRFMNPENKTIENAMDEIIGKEDIENMRGNYWCRDQETLFKRITAANIPVETFERRISDQLRMATRRIDRDGWNYNPEHLNIETGQHQTIIDAHLPRPGYTDENFALILKLMKDKYPGDDFGWLIEYRNNFVSLYNL